MVHLFDYELSYKHALLIVIIVAILASITCAIYTIYSYLQKYSTLRRSVERVYKRLSEKNKERSIERTKEILTYGNATDKTLLSKMDNLITYSGLADKFRWINTETVLTVVIILDVLILLGVSVVEADIIMGICTAIIADTLMVIVLMLMGNRQYIKVEDALPQFMGCIENFSSVSNDIITILDKSKRYIDPILRPAVARCIIDASNSGNQTAALARLEDSFQHKYWKMCIRNISICSRYSCNYTETIENMKDIIDEYISYEKERREQYRNSRILIVFMIAIGIYALNKCCTICGIQVLTSIKGSGFINIIAVIAFVVTLYISIIRGMRH